MPISRTCVLSIAILFCVISMAVLSRPPQPTEMEAAKNLAALSEKIGTWGPSGRARVGFALGFDYLFMAAYVIAIGLGCAAAAGNSGLWLYRLGMIIAYAQIAGGLIDATENAALIRILVHGYDDSLMTIARLATASKFVIPLTGIGYIIIVWPLKHWIKL